MRSWRNWRTSCPPQSRCDLRFYDLGSTSCKKCYQGDSDCYGEQAAILWRLGLSRASRGRVETSQVTLTPR